MPSPNATADRRDRIDFAAVAAMADLQALIEADLGPPDRSRKWACPFHDDRNPSMGITPDGRRFKCWSCQKSGTVIDWLVHRDGLSIIEAARAIDPRLLPDGQPRPEARPRPIAPPPPPKPVKVAPVSDPAWQAAVDGLIRRAEAELWSPAGRDALDWLRARGLADWTIRKARLGFSPEWQASEPLEVLDRGKGVGPEPIKVARGVVLPWTAPPDDPAFAGPWAGGNVRRLVTDPFAPLPPDTPKCSAMIGSRPGFGFPAPEFLASQLGPPLLIAEGEFDALIAHQCLGDLANVVTFGSASQVARLGPSAREILAGHAVWMLALHHDPAGDEAAGVFSRLDPGRARRLYLPDGGDLNDFLMVGGDLRVWLLAEMDRLGVAGPGLREAKRPPGSWADAALAISLARAADPEDHAERAMILEDDEIAPAEFDPWPVVASWPLETQREWSSLAAHLHRESRTDGHPLTGRQAELAAFESMTAGADRPD